MSFHYYIYGTEKYCVRIGFTGVRPLIYALYVFDSPRDLPAIAGQMYKSITEDQYEWLRNHINCDVSYLETDCPGKLCDLECRSHKVFYNVFDSSASFIPDCWDDRQI